MTQTANYDSYGKPTARDCLQKQTTSGGPLHTIITPTGRLTGITENVGGENFSTTFTYDLGRLKTPTHPSGVIEEYVYDSYSGLPEKVMAGTTVVWDIDDMNEYGQITSAKYGTNLTVINYTPVEQVKDITEGNYFAEFTYNSDNQRCKMVMKQNGVVQYTRWYAGSRYMKEKVGTTETHYTWLGGDAYSAPILSVKVNTGTPVIYYILRDHLGSITHVVKSDLSSVKEYRFDACSVKLAFCKRSGTKSLVEPIPMSEAVREGRRRSANDWNYTLDGNDHPLFAGRGFTGHEHLPEFNLINMNGRLYDPVLGRFLSPDNYVQMPDNTQNFNRYSYALNNPLVYTDPDGEWFFSLLFPPAAPVLIFVDAFLWGATIDYASQVVDNISIQKSMGQEINWGDALWNQIDFVDLGVSGLTDAATLGIGKLTKLPQYAKTGLKAANILGSNTIKAHVDYEPGTGWNTSKSK